MSQVELAAREGTVEQFATALASIRIPVGIVTDGVNLTPNWRRSTAAEDRSPVDLERNVLDVFRARQPGYRVHRVNNVYRIEPVPAGACIGEVHRTFAGLTASTTALDAVDMAVGAFNGDPPPQIPVGTVGGDDVGARAIFKSLVSVQLGNVSFGEVLDEIVRSVPGLGWAVREEPVQIDVRDGKLSWSADVRCNVILFSGDAWMATSWMIGPVKSRAPAK